MRQAVVDHLSARSDLNMSQMQVDVNSMVFRQNEADVTVSFRPKGGMASSGMQMRYTLERNGNRWVVKGRGTGPHETMRPPAGQPGAAPGGQMPPAGSQLPPGHPQFGTVPGQAQPAQPAQPAPAQPKK